MAKRSNIDILLDTLDLPGKKVMDVGCGDGELAHRMAAAQAKVTGIDPNPQRIERARASAGRDEIFLAGVGGHLPGTDASIDIVVFFNSLHHIPVADMDAALAEAARVLKPSGILYVAEPVASGSFYEARKVIQDESEIRAKALAAIKGAAEKGLFHEEEEQVNEIVRLEKSFEAYCQRMIEVDPAREEIITAKKEDLQKLFLTHARKTERGYELDTLTRFNLLTRI